MEHLVIQEVSVQQDCRGGQVLMEREATGEDRVHKVCLEAQELQAHQRQM